MREPVSKSQRRRWIVPVQQHPWLSSGLNIHVTHVHAYIHTCTHVYTHIHIHIHTCVYTCVYTYVHMHMHEYKHTHICIHTNIHTCMCTHVYTHTHSFLHVYTHIELSPWFWNSESYSLPMGLISLLGIMTKLCSGRTVGMELPPVPEKVVGTPWSSSDFGGYDLFSKLHLKTLHSYGVCFISGPNFPVITFYLLSHEWSRRRLSPS